MKVYRVIYNETILSVLTDSKGEISRIFWTLTWLAHKTRIVRSCENRRAFALKPSDRIFNTAALPAQPTIHPSIHPSIHSSIHLSFPKTRLYRMIARNHLTLITIRDHQKVCGRSSSGPFNHKKEIESKRAIKSQRIYRSSFFYSSPIFLFPSITICLSIYLSTYPTLSLSLPTPGSFAGLSDLCIVPQSRYPACTQVRICAYMCMYVRRYRIRVCT